MHACAPRPAAVLHCTAHCCAHACVASAPVAPAAAHPSPCERVVMLLGRNSIVAVSDIEKHRFLRRLIMAAINKASGAVGQRGADGPTPCHAGLRKSVQGGQYCTASPPEKAYSSRSCRSRDDLGNGTWKDRGGLCRTY